MRLVPAAVKRSAAARYGDPNDPGNVAKHREIIKRKAFLRKTYRDFYKDLRESVAPAPAGRVLELGSGGGFLDEVMPGILTSDVFESPWLDMVLSAEGLPFRDRSLSAIVCVDVLHHIPDPKKFLREACRCLRSGGRVAMIEPFRSPLSRFVLKNFHDEPFEDSAGADWQTSPWKNGLKANQAMPWIIFVRDRAILEERFKELRVRRVEPHSPLRWLLSGGIRSPYSVPGFCYSGVRGLERLLGPLRGLLSLHMIIELERR